MFAAITAQLAAEEAHQTPSETSGSLSSGSDIGSSKSSMKPRTQKLGYRLDSPNTNAFTVPCVDRIQNEEQHGRDPKNDFKLRASTPRNFGDFFPSQKRLLINHDDSIYDSGMNLKIEVVAQGATSVKEIIQLFHLRTHDLENREFSLRWYCRNSGREVYHYVRKRIESKIPGSGSGTISTIQKALSSIRRRASSSVASISSFRRHSSSARWSVASSRGSISSR